MYADPGRLPSTTVPEYAPELVTAQEAADRCVASARLTWPNATADPAGIDVSPLLAGDQVEIPASDPDSGDLGACGIVSGPLDPVPYPYLPDGVAADDTAAILAGCSAWLRIDLSEWTVGAGMTDGYGGLAAALVSPGQGYVVLCELQSSDDLSGFQDVSIENHTPLPALHDMTIEQRAPGRNGGSGGSGDFDAHFSPCYRFAGSESCLGESTSWAGVLPRGMEKATVVLADGTQIPVPVGPYGTYALSFVSAPGSNPQIHTFAADGSEIGSWPLRQP